MAVIGLLLKYIFIVAIMVVVFIIGTIAYFMHRVRSMAQQFNGAAGTQSHSHNNSGNNRHYQESQDSAHESTTIDEELYDTRNPQQTNRKIFSKGEGEYVDYEEVK